MEETRYEDALRQLEEIAKTMEDGTLDVDRLADKLKEAQTLIRLCKDRLQKTDDEIKRLLAEKNS